MQRHFNGRHEIKFLISDDAASRLSEKLEKVLLRDAHAGENGEYAIRSVYFDDPMDSALLDKLDGVGDRDKYRIRIYGNSAKAIFLERKRKRTDAIFKDSVQISKTAALHLLAGDSSPLLKMADDKAMEFYANMRQLQLRPRVIVDYDREAFVHPVEHTRITFDRRIATGLYETDLFDRTIATVPVLQPFLQVLEVKYDEYLPDFIMPLLSTVPAERMAVSKYVLCRMHEQ